MLHQAEKDISGKADQDPPADEPGSSFPKQTDDQWENDDSGKNEVEDEEEIPGISMFKKGREDHGAIGGEKIENDMADKNGEADPVITPEVGAL
jgi:hypothetical protein